MAQSSATSTKGDLPTLSVVKSAIAQNRKTSNAGPKLQELRYSAQAFIKSPMTRAGEPPMFWDLNTMND